MAISVTCECGKTLFGPDQSAGKRGRCPGCGALMRMPSTPGTTKINTAPAAPLNASKLTDDDLSLDLDAPGQPDAPPPPIHPGDPAASPAIPRKAKKIETERERHGLNFGTVMGIDISIPNIAGFIVVVIIIVSAAMWWRGLTADFSILNAQSVDTVIACKTAEFKSTAQFKLGGRRPNPDFITDTPEGEITSMGSDVVVVTHPDPGGDYVLVRGEVSQQIMHEEKMESEYDMAFRSGSFKIVTDKETIEPWLLVAPVESGFDLHMNGRTADPANFLPPGAVPDKKEEKKDERGRLSSGVYMFTGTNGYTGKFTFQCYYHHDEVFGDTQSLSPMGVIKYKSPGGTSLKYDYQGGLTLEWSMGCDGWVSKASYLRADGNSMYAKFPVMLLFPKPKGGGKATITFCDRKVAKINIDSISNSTAPRVIGKSGATAGATTKPGKTAAPPPTRDTPEKTPDKPPEDNLVSGDPLTGYLSAILKARNKALGVISDLNMAELAKAIFMYVEQNQGQWPDNLDQVEKVCPGTKALAAKAPRRGSDGYIYVKPAQPMGKIPNPDAVVIIFESKDGKIDRSGNACFADGHVAQVPTAP
jgi:prepilin-type processing-associated H-X9-DG protein